MKALDSTTGWDWDGSRGGNGIVFLRWVASAVWLYYAPQRFAGCPSYVCQRMVWFSSAWKFYVVFWILKRQFKYGSIRCGTEGTLLFMKGSESGRSLQETHRAVQGTRHKRERAVCYEDKLFYKSHLQRDSSVSALPAWCLMDGDPAIESANLTSSSDYATSFSVWGTSDSRSPVTLSTSSVERVINIFLSPRIHVTALHNQAKGRKSYRIT